MPIHVLRYDDFSTWSRTEVEEKLVELLLRLQVPCTFAVVPYACDPQALLERGTIDLAPLPSSKARLLEPLLARGLAEVALHGYAHLATSPVRNHQEFSSRMPRETQRRLIQMGRHHLEATFGVAVRLYVPPWNRLSATTAEVLQEEQLLLSGGIDATAGTACPTLPQLPCVSGIVSTRRALRMALTVGGEHHCVGTVLHDYDFHESGFGVSALTMRDFEDTLCRWSVVPNTRRELITRAILDKAPAEPARACANLALGRRLQRSRLTKRLFPSIGQVYWNTKSANRLALCLRAMP